MKTSLSDTTWRNTLSTHPQGFSLCQVDHHKWPNTMKLLFFLQNHLTSFHQDFETTSMAPFYLTLALQTIMQLARGGGEIGHCCNLCLAAHHGTFSGFTRMNTAREKSLNHYRFKWSHNKHLSSQLYQEYKQQQQQLSCHFGWQSPPLIKFQSQLPQNNHIWSVRDNIRKVKWLTHNRIYENVCFVRLL